MVRWFEELIISLSQKNPEWKSFLERVSIKTKSEEKLLENVCKVNKVNESFFRLITELKLFCNG